MRDALEEDWIERVNDQKAKAIESFFEKSKQQSKINHQKDALKETISDLDEVLHKNYHKTRKVDTSPLDKILHPSFFDHSAKKTKKNILEIYTSIKYLYKTTLHECGVKHFDLKIRIGLIPSFST
jgi:hypothetical protein